MNLERFETEFSKLYDFLKSEGFPKDNDENEIRVYGRLMSYHSDLLIINSRLVTEIAENETFNEYRSYAMGKKRMYSTRLQKNLRNHVKLTIDLTDFYLYTRRFLDSLNKIIKIHFINLGKKKPVMEDSIGALFKENNKTGLQKIEVYKQQINFEFFDGLMKKISWVKDFRKNRDGLLHRYDYIVSTTTEKGTLGYDIMDITKKSWGTKTVKDISEELQKTIDNLTDLIEYISTHLPKHS